MALEEQIMKLQTYKMFEGEDIVYVERDDILKLLEQEPCEDAISRHKVLMELDKYLCGVPFDEKGIDEVIKELSPVTPQPKTGHWIEVTNGRGGHECDLCHEYAPSYQSGDEYLSKHCPNCGAKMQEVEE